MGNENQEWAIVRLATVYLKGEPGKLLFATVTELARRRPVPTAMSRVDTFSIKSSGEKVCFRRTILSKEDAVKWYRSLGEGESLTPMPTREKDREEKLDGVSISVSRLEDDQPWPAVGLPISEEIFSRSGRQAINPAPFIGSVPARMHRRFGDKKGFEAFLENIKARTWVARRMHIDLYDYQEYLGSVVYIVPDPIIQHVHFFMVPQKDGHGERIIYRIVPRAGQSLDGINLTAFDKEGRLLTRVKTHQVPTDGVLEVDKGICMGEYGFVITHDKQGVLAYQPPVSFLRQIHSSISVLSGDQITVEVPASASRNAPIMKYPAAIRSELASKSTLGKVVNPGSNVRIATEVHRRERLADARHYGQRWFPENSRIEAASFVRKLLQAARGRIIIADPYFSALQIGQFLYVMHGDEVKVTLLTTRLAFNSHECERNLPTKQYELTAFEKSLDDLKKYQNLMPKVSIVPSSSLHDRFLVIDNEVWFVGNSLNSLGKRASMIIRLPNPYEVIERLEALDSTAESLEDYKAELKKSSK